MSSIYECKDEELTPHYIAKAGRSGRLQCHSCTGWINLTAEDFTGCRSGRMYRVNRIKKEDEDLTKE